MGHSQFRPSKVAQTTFIRCLISPNRLPEGIQEAVLQSLHSEADLLVSTGNKMMSNTAGVSSGGSKGLHLYSWNLSDYRQLTRSLTLTGHGVAWGALIFSVKSAIHHRNRVFSVFSRLEIIQEIGFSVSMLPSSLSYSTPCFFLFFFFSFLSLAQKKTGDK